MFLTATYAVEAVKSVPSFKEAMPRQPDDPELDAYLQNAVNLTMSSPGIFGRAFYDMAAAETGGAVSNDARSAVGLAAHRLMLLQDIVDTRLDTFSESLEDKERFLDDGLSYLLGGTESKPSRKSDLRYRAAFTLAGVIRDMPLLRGNVSMLQPSLAELVDTAKEQFTTQDPERLLGIAGDIGAACLEQTEIPVEIATDTEQPSLRRAARAIGAYGQYLDHLTEVDEDLRDGSPTYATWMITKHGDSKALRADLRERYLDEAATVYHEGIEDLSPSQRRIYRSLRIFIDTKFKLIGRIKQAKTIMSSAQTAALS
jgi:hypothetical protein